VEIYIKIINNSVYTVCVEGEEWGGGVRQAHRNMAAEKKTVCETASGNNS